MTQEGRAFLKVQEAEKEVFKTTQTVPQGALQWVYILKGHVQKIEWARDNQDWKWRGCCESEWLASMNTCEK